MKDQINKIIDKHISNANNFYLDISKLNIEPLIQENINYLTSKLAFKDIDKDPYWDKWSTPWWRINILFEMGLLNLVPIDLLIHLQNKINSHYINFFPLIEQEIPVGIDPTKQIICHCQLGSVYKLFNSFNGAKEFQWARKWFSDYQLPDGGLNCDESVYTNKNPKSSLVSTLPCLEAVLKINNLSKNEIDFLDKGVSYILSKKLFKTSKNLIINENWLKPFFPRFYEYDILRALKFITDYFLKMNKALELEYIFEVVEIIDKSVIDDNFIQNKLYFLYYRQENKTFPLLNYFENMEGQNNIFLLKEWYLVIKNLSVLNDKKLLI